MIGEHETIEHGDLVHDERQPLSAHYRVAGYDEKTDRWLLIAVRADEMVEHRFETTEDVRTNFVIIRPIDPANVANVHRDADGIWMDPVIGFDSPLQALIHAAWLVCTADPSLVSWDDVLSHVRPIALGLGPM